MRWVDMMSKGALDIFWGVLQALAHMCTRLKKIDEKRAFLFLNGPGCAWRVQIRFGAGICVEPVKMLFLSGQIATFA